MAGGQHADLAGPCDDRPQLADRGRAVKVRSGEDDVACPVRSHIHAGHPMGSPLFHPTPLRFPRCFAPTLHAGPIFSCTNPLRKGMINASQVNDNHGFVDVGGHSTSVGWSASTSTATGTPTDSPPPRNPAITTGPLPSRWTGAGRRTRTR